MESQPEENKVEEGKQEGEMSPEELKAQEDAIAASGAFNYAKLMRIK